jgi:AcrR family transcriptional regulator
MYGSLKKWIEAGYGLFAKEGPDGIQVEKLARLLDMNKSGFYHYFGDHEIFYYELMEYHLQVMARFCDEISFLHYFDPDYFNLLIKYQTSIFIQMQLSRHEDIRIFKETYITVKERNDRKFMHLWADYINLSKNDPAALKLWNMVRDVFFLRLLPGNMNLEFMRSLTEEAKDIVFRIQRNSYIMDKTLIIKAIT